jgi:site-specific DNA recombinase
MTRRAAAYLRVSSERQADEDRFGYHRQIAGIREYAARTGLELVAEYRDAITGKSVTRRELDRLVRESGAFDVVVISSVDRLARDVTSSYQVLANLLASRLQVHSADHGLIDLDQESSLIQFNLQALFAHLERQKIVTRTRAAVNAIAAAGQIPDGMHAFGYRTVKRVAEIVPSEALVVRDVFERSARGETLVAIARALTEAGVPRRTGAKTAWRFTDVRQMLRRTTYKGEYRWGPHVLSVPAIVPPDLWARAQPRGRGRPWHTSPLQLLGHVRCGQCGARLSSRPHHARGKDGRRWWSYRCVGANTNPGSGCSLGSISGPHLDAIAERAVRGALANPKRVREMLSSAAEVDDRNAATHRALASEDARWLEAFRAGAITAAELGEYRADVRRRARALADTRAGADRDAREYVRAAKRLPLRELLDLAGVEIVVLHRYALEVRLNVWRA